MSERDGDLEGKGRAVLGGPRRDLKNYGEASLGLGDRERFGVEASESSGLEPAPQLRWLYSLQRFATACMQVGTYLVRQE